MAATDPWTWTVDEAVTQLCRSALWHASKIDITRRPSFSALRTGIRSLKLNGADLLTKSTDDTLQKEWRIHDPGQRQGFREVIKSLQLKSAQYREHATTAGVRALSLKGSPPQSSSQQQGSQSGLLNGSSDSSRKRKRVTEIDTTPLPSGQQGGAFDLARDPDLSFITEGRPINLDNFDKYLLNRYENQDQTVVDESDGAEIEVETDAESDDESVESGQVEDVETSNPQAPKSRKLSRERIIELMNEEIAGHTDRWYPGKLGVDERLDEDDQLDDIACDPYELWHEFQALDAKEKARVLEETQAKIDLYEHKLDRLCEEILLDLRRSEAGVRRQCSVLDVTVDMLEQEKWELSVYEMRHAPPKVDYNTLSEQMAMQPPQAPIAHPRKIAFPPDPASRSKTKQRQEHNHPPTQNRPPPEVIDLGSGSDTDEAPVRFPQRAPKDNTNRTPIFPSPNDYTLVDQEPPSATRSSPSNLIPLDAGISSPPPAIIPSVELPHPPPSSIRIKPPPSSAPKASQLRTQIPHPVSQSPPTPQPSIRRHDSPSTTSLSTVKTWSWPELTATKDRKRIVMKLLSEMSAPDLDLIRTRTTSIPKHALFQEISECVAMRLRGGKRLPGVLPRDLVKMERFCDLFLSFWLGGDYFSASPSSPVNPPTPPPNNARSQPQKQRQATKDQLRELQSCIKNGKDDRGIFYDFLVYVLNHTFSVEALSRPEQPSQAEVIVISDDEGDAQATAMPIPSSVRRRRRRREEDDGIVGGVGNEVGNGARVNERRKRGKRGRGGTFKTQ